MKKYLPTNFDLVDYDRELLKKQLDLETVQVIMDRDAEREAAENDGRPIYVRSVKRFTNEEGMFERLRMDLQRIAQEYGVDEDVVNDTFFGVNCSKSRLIEVLKG